jgi:LPS-assembly protein
MRPSVFRSDWFALRSAAAAWGLAIAVIAQAGATVLAGEQVLILKLDGTLQERGGQGRDDRPVYGRGYRVEGRSGQDVTLQGDAELRRAGTVVRADRLTYYEADDELFAVGQVRVTREGNIFTGPHLRLKIEANEGTFTSPTYYLGLYGGRGQAERIDFLGPKRSRLIGATYTTCGPESPDWVITSRSLLLDEDIGEGSGTDSRLKFKDTLLLATPYIGFPLGDERRSGFLSPSFSITNRSGAETWVPYYWNLAPNRDLTVTPHLGVKRGAYLGADLRYLEPSYSGELRTEFNPNDPTTGTERYFFHSRHAVRNVMGWSGGWDVRGVSDDNYFVDYSRSITTSADRVLPRVISLSRGLSPDWAMAVSVQKYQSILDARPGPYEREPQMVVTFNRRDMGGFDLSSSFDLTQFRHPDPRRTEGLRMFANPRLSYPILRPGWFVVPRASLHLTQYQLTPFEAEGQDLSRSLPTVSLDSGLIFERDVKLAGTDFTQTLEPRLFYVRTPYRDQSAIPVFDSAPADFSFAQLFAENTYVGNDRIADVNQLTVATISRLIDPGTGGERLRGAAGIRQYFSDQEVTIPGLGARTDRRSDLLLAGSAMVGATSNLDAGLQYSLATSRLPRMSLLWRHRPTDGRVFNAGLRYRREQLGQIDLSTRWPVLGGWTALARMNYSFLAEGRDPVSGIPNSRGPIETLGGFEYRASCWVARFVGQRFQTSLTEATTAVFFQLELGELGSIGQNAINILNRNIPGYRVPRGQSSLQSDYFGYE